MSASQFLPLSGMRVLDLTTILFGPYTTQVLGDFGADVIKIEPPGGDLTRDVGAMRNPGMASLYLSCNRNKRSLVLDLKRRAAQDALWRLIETADVFVHNVRPQKTSTLGFDPNAVMARNPAIVYGALHGYREEGPYGGRPAYDDVIQGEAGLAGAFLARDGTPALAPTMVADKTAGLMASTGLMAAVLQRERTGKGVYLEVSMFEGLAAYVLVEHQYGATFVPPVDSTGYPRALSPERRPFATRDGYICMLAYTDKQWRNFWDLSGHSEHGLDPRFQKMVTRANHIDVLYGIVGSILAGRDTSQWLELLGKAEIPAGPVNSFDDLRADPHLGATGFYRPYNHPSEGPLEIPDTAYRFDRQPLPVRAHQPALGEHSRAILGEAGYSDADIDHILEGANL